MRIEALSKVAGIINEAKFITSDIGELPTAICARLSDTNKNIAAEALRFTSSLAAALGHHCKPHTRVIVPGIFSTLGDTKVSNMANEDKKYIAIFRAKFWRFLARCLSLD